MNARKNNPARPDRRIGRPIRSGFVGLLLLTSLLAGPRTVAQPYHRCGVMEHEQALSRLNPLRAAQRAQLETLIRREISRSSDQRSRRAGEVIYRIPVVVHVIHNNASGTIGGPGNGNISNEQIVSQITVLNEDYRRKPGTPGFNTNPVGADTGIEFFLADRDPEGQPSIGITRHYYPQKSSFDIFDDAVLLSQIAYWPSDRYLNIWVTTLRGDFLGWAQFPTAPTLPGLETDEDERTDGALIDHRNFGREIGTATRNPYRLGRTTTHEVAHWLGLVHTWGDDFCGDDYVADTPPTESANQTEECRERFSNCNGTRTRNQIENYLDYSPDACMNLFTRNQRERMRTVLQVSPRRQRLIRSVASLPESETLAMTVSPNPATGQTDVEVRLKGFQNFTVDLVDMTGRIVQSRDYENFPSTLILLPLPPLTAGVYIVRVRTDTETASQRLVIY